MVSQVTPVAILMIVQGAMEIIMGLILMGAAIIMPAFFEEAARQQQAQGAPNPMPGFPGGFGQLMAWIYSAMAAAGVFPGVLRLIAGIRNLRFRGRTFGVVSLFLGLLSLGTIYCSLTSLGLLIYGLIVYFNSDVVYAFTLGEKGVSSGEIKGRYYRDPERFQAGHDQEPERLRDYDEERDVDLPHRPEKGDQFYGDDFAR